MDTRYSSDRPTEGASNNSSSEGHVRPGTSRPRPVSRFEEDPGNARRVRRAPEGGHPQHRQPANGQPARRKPPRRRKPKWTLYLILILAVVIIVALSILVLKLTDPNRVDSPQPASTPEATLAPQTDATVSPDSTDSTATLSTGDHGATLAELLGSEDSDLGGLSEGRLAKVDDLCVNPNLPEDWMNILLLGSDERTLTESARTDSMIICSINLKTGAVKLTSIMRDLAVDYDEIGEYNGTYRINAANFFGGEELAMRIVNERFNMNIENYVHVNFYGFQQIAHMLGGVDMDITEEEMEEINYRIVEQAYAAYKEGIDESNLPNEYLETYGENTHLDGRQTLAYARIRKLDGGDYERANRQRKVLAALMSKLSGQSPAELLSLGTAAMEYLKTNMSIDSILAVAIKVTQSGLSDVESLRLPINGSYTQETRDGQDMLYDCDWNANASELYYFIYGE